MAGVVLLMVGVVLLMAGAMLLLAGVVLLLEGAVLLMAGAVLCWWVKTYTRATRVLTEKRLQLGVVYLHCIPQGRIGWAEEGGGGKIMQKQEKREDESGISFLAHKSGSESI